MREPSPEAKAYAAQIREREHLEWRAQSHGCPKCPALPGERCKTANHKPHVARLRLAQDESFDAVLVRLENDVTKDRDWLDSLHKQVEMAQDRLAHAEQMLDMHVRNGRVQVALDARRAAEEEM